MCMYVCVYIYIYIYTHVYVCPWGDPWGTLLQLETSYSWAPYKDPKGTNSKVTSAKGHFCA